MLLKTKLKFIQFLKSLLSKLYREFNEAEHQDRLATVRSFFHQTLPTFDEKWEGKAIIEDGRFNYFELPSGDLPKYDFVLPEIPLYVVVPGLVSASWPEARDRGIPREKWEAAQLDMVALIKGTAELATIGSAAAPKLLIIKWDDPINHFVLAERLEELIK